MTEHPAIARLRAMHEAAHPIPWVWARGDLIQKHEPWSGYDERKGCSSECLLTSCMGDVCVVMSSGRGEYATPDGTPTGDLIVALRNATPALIELIEFASVQWEGLTHRGARSLAALLSVLEGEDG